jgi:Gpi18-like mannosyltransferase/predicted membrane-bound dolichyl-phosphate-mannose-protein mannosyltransferase
LHRLERSLVLADACRRVSVRGAYPRLAAGSCGYAVANAIPNSSDPPATLSPAESIFGRTFRFRVVRVAIAASLLLSTLVGVSDAGDVAAAPAQTGKLPGLFSGLLLLALLGYSIYFYTAPLLKDRDRSIVRALAILCGIAVVKILLLPWFDGYKNDVSSYESWALQMAAEGPAGIYRAGYFLDYPPGYLYALWFAGIVANAAGAGGVMLRMIVEAPALIADFVLALLVFVFVRRTEPARLGAAYLAMLLVALNPALCFDTVVWGQSDSVLTVVIMLSAALALDGEFELAWGMAALSVLVKPQALMYVPVLGLWTLAKLPYAQWWRSAIFAAALAVAGVLPFQIGHPWYWILELYHSTAAYYHETSVNAFNLMALLGGLRKPDSDTFAGLSYFSLGMELLAPLYAFIGWRLWKERSPRAFMFAVFAAVFGFFMLAPRMHERYLYAALVFAAPLAVEGAEMATVFAILTATCLFNLAYILHTLGTTIFLDSRDGWAMAACAANLVAFALAVDYGLGLAIGAGPLWRKLASLGGRLDVFTGAHSRLGAAPAGGAPIERPVEPLIAIAWLRVDTIVLAALIAAAAATRLWHLGLPAEIVFDEVHFVAQARHYIRAEPFLDPHPPLAKLVIAAGILIFGDHPWSWRIGNALCGILLVALTYMLGRRMFASRLAGALAASFVICDGMFLVDSRIAVIDIVYLTLAAWSYLLLFRFAESSDHRDRRRTLAAMGVALGLCLGAKLLIPAMTFLLCAGFTVYFVIFPASSERAAPLAARGWRAAGAMVMVGALGAMFYVASFGAHFALGWWAGIEDLFHYYGDVKWYERSVTAATHPYSSPWWSWPLMLRPIAYWQNFPPQGKVATIWGGGNPLLWWSALTAVTITAVRALERSNPARTFLVIGYLGYLAIWMPVGRTLFLYHYMPSVYLGYLALAAIIADAWRGEAEMWECAALLVTIAPACVLGLGFWAGLFAAVALGLFALYLLAADLASDSLPDLAPARWAPRTVAIVFVAAAAILFIYYFPIWTAISIDRAGYYQRMWLQGPGLRNWI